MEERPHKSRRGPKPATAAHLENAALHYLERFASSSGNLRRVLRRKVARAARVHGGDPAEGERLVEEIVARYLRSGLLDDRAYAAQQAASLRRRGASRYGIRGRLAVKGVAAELVDEALSALDAEPGDSELAAACALVRRRRLGPCRAPEQRALFRQKDLAALARAGFGIETAQRVLAAADTEALAALERGEG
ncbi:MAG TPA: RecX family transcriptional regulator [Stellaceae bacterium]|nr:RecX family transcriptional regulator [Stellaceae bacterium]